MVNQGRFDFYVVFTMSQIAVTEHLLQLKSAKAHGKNCMKVKVHLIGLSDQAVLFSLQIPQYLLGNIFLILKIFLNRENIRKIFLKTEKIIYLRKISLSFLKKLYVDLRKWSQDKNNFLKQEIFSCLEKFFI